MGNEGLIIALAIVAIVALGMPNANGGAMLAAMIEIIKKLR